MLPGVNFVPAVGNGVDGVLAVGGRVGSGSDFLNGSVGLEISWSGISVGRLSGSWALGDVGRYEMAVKDGDGDTAVEVGTKGAAGGDWNKTAALPL